MHLRKKKRVQDLRGLWSLQVLDLLEAVRPIMTVMLRLEGLQCQLKHIPAVASRDSTGAPSTTFTRNRIAKMTRGGLVGVQRNPRDVVVISPPRVRSVLGSNIG